MRAAVWEKSYLCIIPCAEEARLQAEKEELERKEQEKRDAEERLIRENEVAFSNQ